MESSQSNTLQLEEFRRYIVERKSLLKLQYENTLAYDLSRQRWQGCFQRNVNAALASFYDDALLRLKSLSFDNSRYPVNNGMSELTRQVLQAFHGFSNEFLVFVIDKHRTSCALSNFPVEHKPDRDYVNQVKHDIAELWRNFALTANRHFLESQ